MKLCLAFSPEVAAILLERNYNYIVTGATGWLGRVTLEMLSLALKKNFDADVQAYGHQEKILTLTSGSSIKIKPLTETVIKSNRPIIFFHYAFLTKEKLPIFGIAKYREENNTIRNLILSLITPSSVEGMIVASSGAVYDYINDNIRDANTFEYGRLKYQDEEIFSGLSYKKQMSLVVPRIFNISGPFINKFHSYVLSSIILSALTGKAIQLLSNYPVYRSYVFVGDVIEIALRQILAQNLSDPLIYDTCGMEIIEIGQLAKEICDVLDRSDLAIERPPLIDYKQDRYLGSPYLWKDILVREKYHLLPLRAQIKYTAQYMYNYMPTKNDLI